MFPRVKAAGATPLMPVGDAFWGDRHGILRDPSGFQWGIATHKEDLTPEQMAERMRAAVGDGIEYTP